MRRRSYLVPITLLLVFLALAFTGKLIVDQMAAWPARLVDSASNQATVNALKIRDAFVELFQLQPKISVNETAVFGETKAGLELGVGDRNNDIANATAETW